MNPSRTPTVLLAVACLLATLAGPAAAHQFTPAYLELSETETGLVEVVWKLPLKNGQPLPMEPVLPAGCETTIPAATRKLPNAVIATWQVRCTSLVGDSIHIAGLEQLPTDVLVRVNWFGGGSQTVRLTPNQPGFLVEAEPGAARVAWTYLVLGVEHILAGIDHLLFVAALLLLVQGWKRLLKTVTAFTLAHSLTLALATLGHVRLPSPPVEAAIALSILFLAAEIVHGRRGHPGLTARAPWVVAFSFGLLHGLGFAGALAEVGLPSQAIPLALLFFNVGVEVGQIAFIAAALMTWAVVSRVPVRAPAWAANLPAYAIGTVAALWFIERVVGFWNGA